MALSVDPADTVIAVRELRIQFGATVIHENLDLDIRRGEVVALVGGSGSGKTTLLRAIIMLLKPAAGSIQLFGQEIVGIGDGAAFRLRWRSILPSAARTRFIRCRSWRWAALASPRCPPRCCNSSIPSM